MLQTVNLSKTYELKVKDKGFRSHIEKKEAVRNLDLKIEKGKITGILGINGAGKTTTIKMLATLLAPTSGKIMLDDLAYSEKNLRRIKERINLISGGERSLYWRLTGKENLEYFASLYGIEKADERIEQCLKVVGLSEHADQLVETYSKGMKQRLQIARGIINNPEYLFMDEPTLGLDIAIAQNMRKYIRQLSRQENMAVILSTHYMKEAEELCDYVYVIDHGEKAAEGTVSQLKQQFIEYYEYTVETDDAGTLTGLLPQLNCSFSQSENIVTLKAKENIVPGLFALAEEHHIRITGFHQQESSLEDCIMQIISRKKES